ncbi:hypothetical protein [Actibacterium lipolyticum]|uniref:Uncharacterized protein n=1 Tax=Actibacterium lipolyticum TaxID=1524263 RepID=A0A238KVE1_9RHOB|nr:hypothetical protein [Actibacterium lipolyticum]SMX46152.1 hypothetical protein COL8621_02988 [Actibacterium lipolyticum]
MTQEQTRIAALSYDAALHRFRGAVEFRAMGQAPSRVEVDIPGDVRWSHDRIVRTVMNAAQAART